MKKKNIYPKHVQVGVVVFSQLMLVFAAVLVYPYFAPTGSQVFSAQPPLNFSAPSVTNITPTTATISWTTDQPATTQVRYGRDSRYLQATPVDSALVTNHSVTLTGLDIYAPYSYRIISNGISPSPDNYLFTTPYDNSLPFDFVFEVPYDTSHVVQGYTGYIGVFSRLTGARPSENIVYTFQNVPSGITVRGLTSGSFVKPLQIDVGANVQPGTYSFTVTGTALGKTHSIVLTITVDPAPQRVVPQAYISPPPAIPLYAQWEANMIQYGTKFCDQDIANRNGTWEGGQWYYDGERVYFQISDYLQDPKWAACSQIPESIYRAYVINGNGAPGWRVFTRGLLMDWLRNGDAESLRAVGLLVNSASYSNSPLDYLLSEDTSRETAYAVNAKLDVKAAGLPENSLLDPYATLALGHLQQWFVTKDYQRIAPFMFTLTSEALIAYYDRTGDPRVLPAIQKGADYLWDNMWIAKDESFCYENFMDNTDCKVGAPDLNMLIVYPFGWLYKMTGDPKYLTRGDQIFAGGVKGAWLDQGKQFSQNYRLSVQYVIWRKTLGTDTHGAPPSTSSSSTSSASSTSSSTSSAASITSSSTSSLSSSAVASSSISSSTIASSAAQSTSSSIPFVQVSASSVAPPAAFSRSSVSSSLNPKLEREKALAAYLASQAQSSSSLTSSSARRQFRLKTPLELPSFSGFLTKTINSAQIVFKDVFITDYFAPAVDLLIDLNIVSGYSDANGKPLGLYRPARDVQFAEVAKMLSQLMNLSGTTPANTSAQNTWAAPYVSALETASPAIYTPALNVFTPITRSQVIHTMADALHVTPNPNIGNFFSDTKDPLINTFRGMGIVRGNPDGTFRPDSFVNRAEMATLVGRLLEQGYGN